MAPHSDGAPLSEQLRQKHKRSDESDLSDDNAYKQAAKRLFACLVPQEMLRCHRSETSTQQSQEEQRAFTNAPIAFSGSSLVLPEADEDNEVEREIGD